MNPQFKTETAYLQAWIAESRRLMPLLRKWRDALVARDLNQIESLQAQAEPALAALENLSKAAPLPSESADPALQQLRAQARERTLEIQNLMAVSYPVILDELDYTHALISIIARTEEEETYTARPSNAPGSALLLNTEV